MSRVGNGPFISEFGGEKSELYCAEGAGFAHVKEQEYADADPRELLRSKDFFDIGKGLRMLTGEYGATTKRPRRIGMLDLVMLRQNCKLNGVDELYINKFDCLNEFSRTRLSGIPVVVGYTLGIRKINHIPASVDEARKAKPIIKYFPHIKKDISTVREHEKLPEEVLPPFCTYWGSLAADPAKL